MFLFHIHSALFLFHFHTPMFLFHLHSAMFLFHFYSALFLLHTAVFLLLFHLYPGRSLILSIRLTSNQVATMKHNLQLTVTSINSHR